MKICVLSLGRSGSTSLYNAIKEHLNKDYYCISEPFNLSYNRLNQIEKNQFDLISKKENVLIKTIINHKPDYIDSDTFYDWVFNFFDKVILLDRLDIKSQTESFSYLIHTKSDSWHKKQFFDMSLVPSKLVEEWEKKLIDNKKILNDLSIKYSKKIYYYEDIFINNNLDLINEIFEYMGIKIKNEIINRFLISEDYKVRLSKKTIN